MALNIISSSSRTESEWTIGKTCFNHIDSAGHRSYLLIVGWCKYQSQQKTRSIPDQDSRLRWNMDGVFAWTLRMQFPTRAIAGYKVDPLLEIVGCSLAHWCTSNRNRPFNDCLCARLSTGFLLGPAPRVGSLRTIGNQIVKLSTHPLCNLGVAQRRQRQVSQELQESG